MEKEDDTVVKDKRKEQQYSKDTFEHSSIRTSEHSNNQSFEQSNVRTVREVDFGVIVGHDEIKWLFNKSLKADKPVHILLIGPPACAKSVFLMMVEEQLSGAYYTTGGGSTAAGLREMLFTVKPDYLLIDEIDKMSKNDYDCLLSLCETGRVKVDKFGTHEEVMLPTRVYAACNSTRRIPEEVLSRFAKVKLKRYTNKEFTEVVSNLLSTREGKSRGFARKVARVLLKNKIYDVRDAVRVARLVDTEAEVERVVRLLLGQ